MEQNKEIMASDKGNKTKWVYIASLCLLLIIIHNPVSIAYAGDAAIIQDPDFPTGTMDAGDSISMRVWIKNTGDTTKSFWVEACFLKPEGNPEVQEDWYCALPVESSSIKPNKKDSVQSSYTLPLEAPPGSYGVAVKIWDDYDTLSSSLVEPLYAEKYSWDSFTVTGPPVAPIPIYPNGDTVGESTVSFQWGSVSEATSYLLEVKDSEGGVFFSQNVGQTTVQCLDGFEYGDYMWHVKAINSIGESAWSDEGELYVRLVPSIPSTISPIGDTLTSSAVTFSWEAISYATSYFLEIQNADAAVVYSQNVGDTLSMSVDGLSSGNYEWRVKASNSVGEGEWSSQSTFYVRLPPSPVIMSLVSSSSVVGLGETVTIDIEVRNEGYPADDMWVSVLFPDLEDESNIISYVSSDFNSVPILFDSPDKIDSSYGSATSKAQYPMILVVNTPWGANETRRFNVTLCPEKIGSFTVYAKTVAKLYEEYIYYPESGTLDHQDEYVLTEVVEVVELANPPVADIGGPYTDSEGEMLLLDASGSSDPDNDITQYEWDLDGDGVYEHVSVGSQISNIWEDDYVGELSLRVTDATGLSSTDSCTVTINNVAPTVDAGPDIDTESLEVSFTAQIEDPGSDTYTIIWDYSDGTQSTGTLNPVHEYVDYGVYFVIVTVTDDDGSESLDSLKVHITEPKISSVDQEISIEPSPPTADLGGPYISSEGEEILFDARGSSDPDNDITQYEWDLDGDGVFEHQSTENTIVSTWEDDYQGAVSLRVTDSTGLSSTDSCTVTITNVSPVVDAGPDIETESLQVSFIMHYEDPGSDTQTIVWDFGDGEQTTDTLSTEHEYMDYGVYSVNVSVTDDDGGVSWDILEVNITEPVSMDPPEEYLSSPPTAVLGGPYMGYEGEPIILEAGGSTDPDNDITQYEWDLNGDGSYDEATISHTSNHTWSDDYIGEVSLRVTDSQGNQAEAYTYVEVFNVIPSVEADEDILVDLGEEVQFMGAFTDPGEDTHTILWDFGDGETSDIINPSHVYNSTGVFTATLNVMDDNMGESSDNITVTVLASTKLELDIIPSSGLSLPVNIKGILNSNGAPLKNGNIITEYRDSRGKTWTEIKTKKTNPQGEFDSTWTPQTTGTYLIRARYEGDKTDYINNASIQTTLAVTEGVGDYVFSVTSNSIITDLKYNSSKSVLQFTFSGEPETYSHTQILIAKTIVTDIEDLLIYIDEVEVNYTYTSDENQWIMEFEHSHSTHDVIITLAQTENQYPVAQTETNYEINQNVPISFDASGSYDSDGLIVEYLWDFGDGENLTGVDVKHKYNENGEYVGTLTVTDNLGATDTVTFSVKIGSIEPENFSDNVGSNEIESSPIIANYEYQLVRLQTGQDLLDMSYSTGATELENLDSQKAAELISQVPEEEAALYLSQMNSESRNQIMGNLSPSNASSIMEYVSPTEGVEILVALEDETTLSILEEMDNTLVSTLLAESVNQGEIETFGLLMNNLDETKVAECLLGLDPVSGARIVESMSRDDLHSAAIRVETIVKMRLSEKDPERAENMTMRISETMLNADTESLVDIFIEIANLPETPSTVAALFEMMPYAKVREVVELWMNKARYEELAKVFSYLPTRKLSEIYLGTSAVNRATLYQYLDTNTKASTPQTSFFEITDLKVSQSNVYPSQPVTISARVSNVGAEASTYRLKLLIDQEIVAEEMLYIESGYSETLSWIVNRTIPKTYFISLGLLKESFVVEKEFAHIFSSLKLSKSVTEPGIPVQVKVCINNTGGVQEIFNAELKLDGEYITTVSETLDGGDSYISSFNISCNEEGMHEVSFGDKTCLFLVEKMDDQSLWELLQQVFLDVKSMLVNRLGSFFIGLRIESVYPLGSDVYLFP